MTSPRIYARALGGSALSAAVVAAMLIAPPGATAAVLRSTAFFEASAYARSHGRVDVGWVKGRVR